MHIVILSARIPPTTDGVGDYSVYLAAALLRRGMCVTLACGTQADYAPPTGAELWAGALLEARQHPAAWVSRLRTLRPDWLLLQYVPYAFHQRGLPFFLPSILKKARYAGIRTGIIFHEVHIRPRENRLLSLAQRWLARRLGRQADLAITSIPFYQQMLARLGIRAHVLPVGANIEVGWPTAAACERLRQQYFPGKAFVVSTFGRRDVRALATAVAQMPEAGLLLVGEGPPRTALPGFVRATGYLPASEICTWLRSSDVFALPDPKAPDGTGGSSLKSGSLAAAFAAGLPVVGVRGDMTAPPLVHGENIWLIEHPRPDDWKEVLLRLRQQPDLCRRLAQGAHRLYREHLDWEVLADQLQHLLRKAVEK
jgi:glycosyltransferase involved in cell wall biosynthesis